MDFFRLVLRFIPEYKGRITAYVLMNFIASVFSVFSFIALIPLIQLLFGLSDETFEYVETQGVSSYNGLLDAAKNNILTNSSRVPCFFNIMVVKHIADLTRN